MLHTFKANIELLFEKQFELFVSYVFITNFFSTFFGFFRFSEWWINLVDNNTTLWLIFSLNSWKFQLQKNSYWNSIGWVRPVFHFLICSRDWELQNRFELPQRTTFLKIGQLLLEWLVAVIVYHFCFTLNPWLWI